MANWYNRIKGIPSQIKFITNKTDGSWTRCPSCKQTVLADDVRESLFVCKCGHHFRIGSFDYFDLLFDNSAYEILFDEIQPVDFMEFTDRMSYQERLEVTQSKTELDEAASLAKGYIDERPVLMVAMDFNFIGGSMGAVIGQKISHAIDICLEQQSPFIMISKSGGARLMESSVALVQMAKIISKLNQLSKAKIPYLSVLTDPTIGSVASIGMLGDIIFAEPEALIGYASPKVVKESVGKELSKGFQRAESLLENGFIDQIVVRKELRTKISQILAFLTKNQLAS